MTRFVATRRWAAVATVCTIVALLSVSTWLESPRDAMTYSLSAYGAAFIAYALVARFQAGWFRLGMPEILVGAVLMRAAMLMSDMHFSDDVWRYLWDGTVQTSGINPYLHAPGSDALSALRDTTIWPAINHKEVPTIYPPVAQVVFWFNSAIGSGVTGLRVAMICAEAALLPAIWRLSHANDQTRRARVALLLLWNPLMVVEFSGSAHLDILAITPLIWSLAIARSAMAHRGLGLWCLAGVALGISIAAKLIGFIALPSLAIWIWRRSPRRALAFCTLMASTIATVVITFTPYQSDLVFSEGSGFSESVSTYARKWRFNDGPFRAIAWAERQVLSQARGVDGGIPRWEFKGLSDTAATLGIVEKNAKGEQIPSTTIWPNELETTLAKVVAGAFLLLLLAFCLKMDFTPSGTTFTILMATLLLAPVVHPWYLTWLIPLAIAHRSRSALLWSGLVIISYHAAWLRAADGQWRELDWPRWIEYVPVLALAAHEAWRRLTRDFDVNGMRSYGGLVSPSRPQEGFNVTPQ